jgi:hypothetical protein
MAPAVLLPLCLKQESKANSPQRKRLEKKNLQTVSMSGLSVLVCLKHRECSGKVCPDNRPKHAPLIAKPPRFHAPFILVNACIVRLKYR